MAAWGSDERRARKTRRWSPRVWRRILSLLAGAGATAALVSVAHATFQPGAARASDGGASVVLDGQTIVLPNQGDPSKVGVHENLALDCEPGTIVAGDKVTGSGRFLSAAAGAGEAVLAVSIKSGSNNVSSVEFSADGVTVTTSQDISSFVLVSCRPQQEPATPDTTTGGGAPGGGAGESEPAASSTTGAPPSPAPTSAPAGEPRPAASRAPRPAATPRAKRRTTCPALRLTPRAASVGRRLVVRLRVTRRGRPVARARVALSGVGVKKVVRTRRTGRATVVLRPRRTGFVRVRVVGAGCGSRRIGVFGVFQPPSLTG